MFTITHCLFPTDCLSFLSYKQKNRKKNRPSSNPNYKLIGYVWHALYLNRLATCCYVMIHLIHLQTWHALLLLCMWSILLCPNAMKFSIAKHIHITVSLLTPPPPPQLIPPLRPPTPARPSPTTLTKPRHHNCKNCRNDHHHHNPCYCCNLYHNYCRHYHAFKNIIDLIVIVLLSLNEVWT